MIIQLTVYGEPIKSIHTKPIEYSISEKGCWECVSHAKDRAGYPVVTRNGKFHRMSRYIYECEKGEIPDGMIILHSCDNPECINPAHLSAGTPADNSNDMVKKGRQAKGEKRKPETFLRGNRMRIRQSCL